MIAVTANLKEIKKTLEAQVLVVQDGNWPCPALDARAYSDDRAKIGGMSIG